MKSIVTTTRINNEVIKTRQFDALFYGQVMGADPDPYAFWHSSQTGESGFNIANFASKEADKLLEDARVISDKGKRQEIYFKFQDCLRTAQTHTCIACGGSRVANTVENLHSKKLGNTMPEVAGNF